MPCIFAVLLIRGLVEFNTIFLDADTYPPSMLWAGRILVVLQLLLVVGGMIYGVVTAPGGSLRSKCRTAFKHPREWVDVNYFQKYRGVWSRNPRMESRTLYAWACSERR